MEVGDGEITLLDADVTMSRQTRRQARVAAARRVDQRRAAPPKATRRRVVHRMDSSSEEEEVVMRNMGAGRMDRTMGQGPRKVPSVRCISELDLRTLIITQGDNPCFSSLETLEIPIFNCIPPRSL